MGQVVSRDQLAQHVREWKRSGKGVVFTNGCFDLLHPGHIRLLEDARSLGDLLVVAINTDASVRGNKGPSRPVIREEERAEVLASLAAVDCVVLFDQPTPLELIQIIVPNVLVKGSDWGLNEVVGRKEVEAAGGRVVSILLQPGYSTTELVKRITGGGEPAH